MRRDGRRLGLNAQKVTLRPDPNELRESRGRIERIGSALTEKEEMTTVKSIKAEMPSLLDSALLVPLWELMLSRTQHAMIETGEIATVMNEKNDAEGTENTTKNLEGEGTETEMKESLSTWVAEIQRKGGIAMMICHRHLEMVMLAIFHLHQEMLENREMPVAVSQESVKHLERKRIAIEIAEIVTDNDQKLR